MGGLGCEGHLGECRFKTGMGKIRLDRTGALHLKTGMGNMAVDRVLGDAEVTTGSGEVLLGVGDQDGTDRCAAGVVPAEGWGPAGGSLRDVA